MAMIFQEPLTALNPVMRCGDQLEECYRLYHPHLPTTARLKAMQEALEEVQLRDTSRIFQSYPHQLSGGQRQRLMIAMALSGNPSLLIADEPTTALDVEVQASLVQLLKELRSRRSLSLWFISHDLPLMSGLVQRAALMQRGTLVESGPCPDVWVSGNYPRFSALLGSKPHGIPKSPARSEEASRPVLEAKSLSWTTPSGIKALNHVSFTLQAGETLGLVGGSGSGKSSLARIVAGLLEPSGGELRYLDQELWQDGRFTRDSSVRLAIQMVFQDPYSSLNPAHSVQKMLGLALRQRNPAWSEDQKLAQASVWLRKVRLDPEQALYRRPSAFSGGQRQRLVLARALSMQPRVLICDESIAALDGEVQAEILDLLKTLQAELGFSMIFITHDLSVAAHLCHRLLVLQEGSVCEYGETATLMSQPQALYTQRLIQAIPRVQVH
jgi:peptide/nickel transport system ATP-binding protein